MAGSGRGMPCAVIVQEIDTLNTSIIETAANLANATAIRGEDGIKTALLACCMDSSAFGKVTSAFLKQIPLASIRLLSSPPQQFSTYHHRGASA
eukprot:609185-Amphidinium_carterae.1